VPLPFEPAGTLAQAGHQLPAGERQARLGVNLGLVADSKLDRVGGQVAVGYRRPDTDTSLREILDTVGGQAPDVHDHLRRCNLQLHQVHEVRPAGKELRVRLLGEQNHSLGRVVYMFVAKRFHRWEPPLVASKALAEATAEIAATMFA
jgi:hypothetical protein